MPVEEASAEGPSAPPIPLELDRSASLEHWGSEASPSKREAAHDMPNRSPSSTSSGLAGGSVLIRPWAAPQSEPGSSPGGGSSSSSPHGAYRVDIAAADVAVPPRWAPPTMTHQPSSESPTVCPHSFRTSPDKPMGAGPQRPLFQNGAAGVTAYVSCTLPINEKPQKPSRTASLRQRHSKQLRQCDRDQYGVPIAATARPFSIWASPQKIGEACTGLGIHFASLKAFIALALLLSIVAIYPLVNDTQTQRWDPSYSLVLNGVTTATCSKPWNTHNWITGTTIGGHCSAPYYSSGFDCAATCVASAERLKQPQCAGQRWRGKGNSSAQACSLHLPCDPDVTDPQAPHGPCHCCELALDKAAVEANPEVSSAQLWVFLVGNVAFLLWMLVLAKMQLDAIHKVDARVVSASDFSVMITGINTATISDKVLQEWCQHYGSVVMAASIPTFGSALKVAKSVRFLQIRKAEAYARLHEDCPPAPWLLRPWSWLYWACVVGDRRKLANRLDAAQHKLEVYSRQELEPTGAALAVFCYGEHAANCILDHRKSLPRQLLSLVPGCCCAAEGLCAAQEPKLAGATVTVVRAPEPSDFIWEHTSVTGARAVARRLWSWTLTALVIVGGLGVQYGLAVLAEHERSARVYDWHLDPKMDFSTWGTFTTTAWAATRLRWIALLTGLCVVVVNWCITIVVRQLSVYERWHTRTSLERWTAVKLTLFYLANSFGVPVLAAYLSSNTSSWFSRGGLVESAFWTQAANALLPPLVNVLGPANLLFFHLLARFAKTQDMLNWLMAPPEFPLAEQYASAVATLGLGVWYMPVLPMSPMIATIGLFLAYWADKWVALRRAAHPGNLNGQVTSNAVGVLVRLLPLVQLVLLRYLYFKDYTSVIPVFWTGLGLWLLFALAPLRSLLGFVRHVRNTSTGGLTYQELCRGGGLDDAYMPQVPSVCPEVFRQEVTTTFTPPAQPLPAIERPMLHQKATTAGPATRPPSLRASSALAPGTLRGVVAALDWPPMTLTARGGGGSSGGAGLGAGSFPGSVASSVAVSIDRLPLHYSMTGTGNTSGDSGPIPVPLGPAAVIATAAAAAAGASPSKASAAAAVQPPLAQRAALEDGPLAKGSRVWALANSSSSGLLGAAAGSAGAAPAPARAAHTRGLSGLLASWFTWEHVTGLSGSQSTTHSQEHQQHAAAAAAPQQQHAQRAQHSMQATANGLSTQHAPGTGSVPGLPLPLPASFSRKL